MDKPVVYFDHFIGWSGDSDVQAGMWTLLGGVTDHPVLGDEPIIYTSTVLSVTRDDATGKIVEIETLNTVYRIRPSAD